MIGPPGTGKTMLASRLPGILPPMSNQEALESAAVQSISQGGFNSERWRQRPFRTPHHTASGVALVGGGDNYNDIKDITSINDIFTSINDTGNNAVWQRVHTASMRLQNSAGGHGG